MTTKPASKKRVTTPTPNQSDFYRVVLDIEEQRLLTRARRHKGLRAEAALMRVLLMRFVKTGDYEKALQVTTTIARLEEGQSRIASRKVDAQEEIEQGQANVANLLARLFPERLTS